MHNICLLDVIILSLRQLVFFDDTVSSRSQVHHDLIAKKGANFLDGYLLRFWDVQVDDDDGDEAKTHVDEVHPIFAA